MATKKKKPTPVKKTKTTKPVKPIKETTPAVPPFKEEKPVPIPVAAKETVETTEAQTTETVVKPVKESNYRSISIFKKDADLIQSIALAEGKSVCAVMQKLTFALSEKDVVMVIHNPETIQKLGEAVKLAKSGDKPIETEDDFIKEVVETYILSKQA